MSGGRCLTLTECSIKASLVLAGADIGVLPTPAYSLWGEGE